MTRTGRAIDRHDLAQHPHVESARRPCATSALTFETVAAAAARFEKRRERRAQAGPAAGGYR
jgi:hypothetical protein